MAITPTVLQTGNGAAASTNHTTASMTPAANSLLVIGINVYGTAAPTGMTVTGLGLTWQRIDTIAAADNLSRLDAWKAQCGASPGAGTINISLTGTAPSGGWPYHVLQITGQDTSNPVPQSAKVATTFGTTPSLTMSLAAVSTASRPFVFFGSGNNTATPRTNWTELADTDPYVSLQSQWRADAWESTASATLTQSFNATGIAFEVAPPGAVMQLAALGVG